MPSPNLPPENSSIREKAIKILFLRGAGMPDEQIAEQVGLSVKTLSRYLYQAERMGWLDGLLIEPKERLEYEVLNKVVSVIKDGLDDEHRNEKTGMQVKTHVALKVAEGALYPRLQQQPGGGNTMMMGIKIEVVGGAPQEVREGTVIEAPAYEEGVESD